MAGADPFLSRVAQVAGRAGLIPTKLHHYLISEE